MKSGTVLIYHSTGLLPKLIRKFTKSNWNHVGIIGEMTDYGYIVYEAQAEGFIKSEYTFEYLQRRMDEGTIVSKEFNGRFWNVPKEAEELIGQPYGFLTLIKIAWAIISQKKSRNWSDGEKSIICSEGVSRILFDCSKGRINLPSEFGCTHDYITPKMIFESTQ